MNKPSLFPTLPPVVARQPKTDRLVLARFLRDAAADMRLDEAPIHDAHEILIKWAELEATGKLLKETQMQGTFLDEVFGQALGYTSALSGEDTWHYEQHHTIAGEIPDAVLGHFQKGADKQLLGVIELKGPTIHLDRDRSNGRTAIDQCWD